MTMAPVRPVMYLVIPMLVQALRVSLQTTFNNVKILQFLNYAYGYIIQDTM